MSSEQRASASEIREDARRTFVGEYLAQHGPGPEVLAAANRAFEQVWWDALVAERGSASPRSETIALVSRPNTEIAHPYTCDCSYPGQRAEHRCCSECGDDWDDCECAARLRVDEPVVWDGHHARVAEVYPDGRVRLQFAAGPQPAPWFTAPYAPIDLERP